jgi:hypothetical protein
MAARKTRRKTSKRRKSSKRRRKSSVARMLSRVVKPRRKKARTAAQKRATAKLVAMNKARRSKKSHHMLPALPKYLQRGNSVHTQPTYRPSSHRPTRVMDRIDHEFYD